MGYLGYFIGVIIAFVILMLGQILLIKEEKGIKIGDLLGNLIYFVILSLSSWGIIICMFILVVIYCCDTLKTKGFFNKRIFTKDK